MGIATSSSGDNVALTSSCVGAGIAGSAVAGTMADVGGWVVGEGGGEASASDSVAPASAGSLAAGGGSASSTAGGDATPSKGGVATAESGRAEDGDGSSGEVGGEGSLGWTT